MCSFSCDFRMLTIQIDNFKHDCICLPNAYTSASWAPVMSVSDSSDSATPRLLSLRRRPSAGDSNHLFCKPQSQCPSLEMPESLISGYAMQWALNQHMGLVRGRRFIKVNAYKLATQSRTFTKLIKEVDIERRTRRSTVLQEKEDVEGVKSVQIPLMIECQHSSDVNDLALAVHFCHLGKCRISAVGEVERSDTPPRKKRDQCPAVDVNSTGQPLLSTGQLQISSSAAECCLTCGLRIANTYGIEGLHKLCIDYIRANLTQKTCWALWKVVFVKNGFNTLPVDDRAGVIMIDFVQTHFRDFMRNDECSNDLIVQAFTSLSVSELELLLASDRLNVRSESEVVMALQLWIDGQSKDPKTTGLLRKHVPRLIDQCVRLNQLTIDQVDMLLKLPGICRLRSNAVSSNENAASSSVAADQTPPTSDGKDEMRNKYISVLHQTRRKLLRTTLNLRPLAESSGESSASKEQEEVAVPSLVASKYTPRIPHEAVFVFGGWENGQPCSTVRVLDSRLGVWISHLDCATSNIVLPHPLMSFGVTNVDNKIIYIAGGEIRNGQATQEVLRYTFDDGWKGCSPMHEIRRDLLLVNLDNTAIYAIGGDNNRAVLDSVECLALDPNKTNSWIEVANLLVPRGAPAGDVLNGKIYVCGGYTESRMEALTNSCELYTPATNQWTLIQPMAQPRYYASAVAFQNHVYILGGGGDNVPRLASSVMALGYSSTVERYTPEEEIWELMPAIAERADFAACIHEGEIICIGGGGEAFCTAETELWTPWVGNSQSSQNSSAQTSRPAWVDDIEEEIVPETYSNPTSPVWMNAQSSERDLGWRKGVQLPSPLWGHRCICVKGLANILPFLNRTEIYTALNRNLAPRRWRIVRHDGVPVLRIDDTNELPQLQEDEENRDGDFDTDESIVRVGSASTRIPSATF